VQSFIKFYSKLRP